ncbi:hypothetical protein TrCOL_g3755 [Triparma columacea]|uniref:Uncharacterized protein n=1 Tax=Triparma columacea TaxID=722753 RepID=A0A9W7G8G5_9STRA|nr:hypothetical protein TrCOL_g3755 [Triparma columacea]
MTFFTSRAFTCTNYSAAASEDIQAYLPCPVPIIPEAEGFEWDRTGEVMFLPENYTCGEKTYADVEPMFLISNIFYSVLFIIFIVTPARWISQGVASRNKKLTNRRRPPTSTIVEPYTPVNIGNGPGSVSFNSLFVETVETVRMTFLFNTLVRNGKFCMFVGNAGTGKTGIISKLPQVFGQGCRRNHLKPPTREEIREALDVFETLSRSTSSFQSVADAPLEYSMLTPAERTMSMSDDNRIVLEGLYGKLKDTGGLKLYASAQLDAGDNPSIAEMEGALGMKVTAFSPKGAGDSGGVLGLGSTLELH